MGNIMVFLEVQSHKIGNNNRGNDDESGDGRLEKKGGMEVLKIEMNQRGFFFIVHPVFMFL